MDPWKIIKKYYEPTSLAYHLLTEHSSAVAEKALLIADRMALSLDREFIYEAAMLHDIGIFLIQSPELGCYGEKPYICHGYLGRELLEREGYPRHALVAERHIGVGISLADIDVQKLPIPRRAMVPETEEEEIIAYADNFYSKKKESLREEKSVEKILASLAKYGSYKVERFQVWMDKYGV